MVRSMTRLMVAGLCAAVVSSVSADDRVSASKKGSLLIYSKVEIKWVFDGAGFPVVQDTFIDMSNDYPTDVEVQLYFVNGDAPTEPVFVGDPPVLVEREHPGWNWVDCQILLTANQPTYMSILSGLPAGCQPFTVLDPGFPPGRPDPEVAGGRILRGFVYAWAVDNNGEEIRHNHLSGDAILINYQRATAAEYNAYAAAAINAAHGDASDGVPGRLLLNGSEYDMCFDKLLIDFYASGSFALSGPVAVLVDTDITLHSVTADLRQDTTGPVTTKAKYDIWNQNENRFSGTEKCITCWDQTLASLYPAPNHLLRANLQTDKGKARVDGLGSTQCPLSRDAALLGVQIKQMFFANGGFATSAITMVGQGEQDAAILYDIIERPDEAQNGEGFTSGSMLKSGRTGR
ncbi:MAG: hypothetical protein AABZ47_00930 [Planctomycetota bacterium]